MRLHISWHFIALAILSLAFRAHAGECDDPKSSEEIAHCLGKDLRDSDSKINESYKELMGKLSESEKTNLRQTQRTWIKDRDSVCQLNTRETNREKWYESLLKDYSKTVCVTRYTRQRTADMGVMLAKLSPQKSASPSPANPASPATPSAPAIPDIAYDKRPATAHSSGKWYFELTVNYGESVTVGPCVVTVGVSDKLQYSGILDNIRPRDSGKNSLRYGFAVDLDNGKLYTSQNGEWLRGDPGSNGGVDLKLGRNYFAAFSVSADSITPYLDRKAIVPNFGDVAMAYALPAGYSPWRSKGLK